MTKATSSTDIGAKLLEKKVISDDQLEIAKKELERDKNDKNIGAILVEMGFVSEGALGEILNESSGIKKFDLSNSIIDAKLVKKLPKEFAMRNKLIAVSYNASSVTIGMADVFDIVAIDQVRRFFPFEFKGVLPVEILIDTKRKKGVMKISTLKKMDELQSEIEAIPELSKPVSIVNLVKFSKQAYYNGNPAFYDLPDSQEQAFILPYLKNSSKDSKNNPLKSYVDSTGQYARISTFMREVSTDEMVKVEEKLNDRINKLFPKERFTVTITGKALLFQKGTSYLLENLIESLLFALALTGALIFFLFRSVKMIFVALIPNLLPLLATAGLMGYLGIPIKPSTILVFGIAFGLSVDDTIRFLAQYRQELVRNNWKIRKSIFATLNEEGPSMFYTSFVLLFGFSVFTLSDFGGTVALGGLVSITLLFGMLTNLILLPSLVLSLNRSLANAQELKEPRIDILENDDDPDAVVEEIIKK